MNQQIYVALDFKTKDEAFNFLKSNQLQGVPVKVGMQLFYREGPELIKELKGAGHPIFLDLKLHDIPNTVYQSMKSLASLEIDLVNVHAAGGIDMMRAAKDGLADVCSERATKLIAVTQLTSTSKEMLSKELLIDRTMEEVVDSYALSAKQAGLDGVVCSVWEAKQIKESCGESFLTVTPGIRLEDDDAHDQKRVSTPSEATYSDYLVIGRSITKATDPKSAYERALREWNYEHRKTIN